MGLNNSTGNMYKFVTHTWNTIKGKCPHGCVYCYVKKWGSQPDLHFDERELKTDLGYGNTIFVGSSCDMFAEGIDPKWVIRTLMHCENYKNSYFLQTKNPKAFELYGVGITSLHDFALCITMETNRWYKDVMVNAPDPVERAMRFYEIPVRQKYITIEPIMDFDMDMFIRYIKINRPLQVNIGANTSNVAIPEPSKDKVLALISELETFTIVHQKSNLKRLL